ncbi:MAG: Sec-independent protein translocase subunit TatA [Nakamurella sp.]
MGGLSWWHWIIILSVFVLLFGAKKLPDAARGVGRSLRILKSEVSAMSDDDKSKDGSDDANRSAAVIVTPTPVVAVPAPALQNTAEPQLTNTAANTGVRSTTAA